MTPELELPLSCDDLGLFFEERHAVLGQRLRAAAIPLEASSRAGGPVAARVARELGERFALYDLLEPDPASGRIDVRSLCLAREMLGWAAPIADAIFAVQGLASFPLVATDRAKAGPLLAALRQGAAIGGFALTEPEAGSDVAAIATRAVREGDGWRLDGLKTFISNAGIATFYTVFATIDPAAGKRGLTAFLVPADAPGLTMQPLTIGDHPIGRLSLVGVKLPGDAAIGELGGGFALAMATLDTFRVTVGAAAVGMARRAFAEARRHVMRRRQFGQRLADQQLVQAHLADMATELDAARLLVLRAAHALDRGERASIEVSMAKLHATEAAQRIIDAAVQLHGGRGVTEGEVVEGLYRAIRPLRIYEGTSEIQRLIIGRALTREA
jgi:acyl-CoA dehydrogenase